MSFNRGLFSSARLDWATPKALYQALDAEFRFAVDACADDGNAKCPNFLRRDEGLSVNWPSPAFLNPPYGHQIGKWVARAYEQSRGAGVTVVALLPSRTDTRWWHSYVMEADEI